MNKSEIKAKIKEDFRKETPELYEKIEKSCRSTVQEAVAVMEPKKRRGFDFNIFFKRA